LQRILDKKKTACPDIFSSWPSIDAKAIPGSGQLQQNRFAAAAPQERELGS